MIFSKTIFKLASGTSVSIYAKDQNNYEFFAENNGIQKYNLSTTIPCRCITNGVKQGYNHITKITDDLVCLCFDDNISVAYEN